MEKDGKRTMNKKPKEPSMLEIVSFSVFFVLGVLTAIFFKEDILNFIKVWLSTR